MKKILIISPHYPPSNLAAVHRSRLFSQHLPAFGWNPIILTVHEDFYEEALDWNLHKLITYNQRIEKVSAIKVGKPRLVGDIGLRAYFQLRRRALELIRAEKIDFVYIPIPSFYTALLGPYLFKRTGIPYGIDYIDPWVHQFPGSERIFSRHWFSTQLANILEPIAVKHARPNGRNFREERHKIEVFQEFYVEDKTAMEDLIGMFAVNAKKFDYKRFFGVEETPSKKAASK